MLEIIKSHSRFKGLPWYEHLQQVNILGAGGIGSWVALSLARQGHKVLVQDYDRVEPHNLGGQLYSSKSIGKLKVTALTEIIRESNGKEIIFTELEGLDNATYRYK